MFNENLQDITYIQWITAGFDLFLGFCSSFLKFSGSYETGKFSVCNFSASQADAKTYSKNWSCFLCLVSVWPEYLIFTSFHF